MKGIFFRRRDKKDENQSAQNQPVSENSVSPTNHQNLAPNSSPKGATPPPTVTAAASGSVSTGPSISTSPSAFRGGPSRGGKAPFKPRFNKPPHKPQGQKGGFFHSKPGFSGKLRIIALGGLDEVGKNCMVLEYGRDIILIDLGYEFPDDHLLGVDYVIPDISYLADKLDRIRGIVFTHGHLDHIGAVSHLMQKLNFPVLYGTKLTMALVEKQLTEFGLTTRTTIKTVTENDILQLGAFQVSFFSVNHSIPDAVGVVVKTPAGNIVHTGDFKFDFTPSGSQKPADFARIASLSKENIAALFIDSTNALKAGYTITEKKIGDSLESIIRNNEGRILIASFSSQIGRMQQIFDAAKKYGRTVYLSGRSLVDNVALSIKLGYIKVPQGLVHDIRRTKKLPEQKVIILTTGSQGEEVSALSRISLEDHPVVKIKKGDTVVLSSSPIPGNEKAVTAVTNNLCRLGARIINNQIMDVHTSGHAQQEDLKLMMSLVKAKYVVPVHGEYYMRFGNKEVAMNIGYDDKHTVLIENGDVLEIENGEVSYKGEKVSTNYILVDGLGYGDVGAQVILDRQTLAENGMLIVTIPVDTHSRKLKGDIDVISRGFIYMNETAEITQHVVEVASKAYKNILEKRPDANRADIKKYLRDQIERFVIQKIDRQPLVLPIIVEK